ncbi:hypothetical protein A1OK_01915 [Enterovibrio norvegicus FF-454]|uniref:Uncharacterized protein n=1 Tax=Enterovibrio norvegicus FF-454 TaxID=1185651 RepID=A0A1E5BZU9_9GAMM|nr:hypothetical protein [Enterovibrio norvegicus]OEE58785.1 hypothetical protein A1OK_01915 [Enterovibrio norvegicus FF-454]
MNKHLIAVMLIVLASLPSRAATVNECEVSGYAFGFFNGVANTAMSATRGLNELRKQAGYSQYNGEDVEYRLFYNDSRFDENAKYLLGDLAETFDQRTNELDQRVAERWEAFWDVINGRSNSSIIERIISIVPAFAQLITDVFSTAVNEIITRFLQTLSSLSGGTINTDEVRMQHQLINDSYTWQGKKLVYVAHSQGNLWANESFNHVLGQEGYSADNIAIVHIAPASPILNGDYVLSSSDFVINGLQFTGPTSVPLPNALLPITRTDPSGHMLIESYLGQSKTRTKIKSQISNAFDRLSKPEMEDYLFQMSFEYSANFVQHHEKAQFDFVDTKKNREYCDFLCDAYLSKNASLRGYSLKPSENVKPLIFVERKEEQDEETNNEDGSEESSGGGDGAETEEGTGEDMQGKTRNIHVETCQKIPEEGSFLFGEFSNITDLSSPLDMTKKLKVIDRYGDTWISKTRDVSPRYEDGYSPCAGNGENIEIIASQAHYTSKQKIYLEKNDLSGNYRTGSTDLDGTCILH